jgi:hypothetical protein
MRMTIEWLVSLQVGSKLIFLRHVGWFAFDFVCRIADRTYNTVNVGSGGKCPFSLADWIMFAD